jgi:peptidoglycan hydrolase-like protein with peptidoglycan-binding domain
MLMAGDNEKDKKGFSGLSDLASEISGIDEPIKQEPKAESKPSAPKQPPQPQRETAASETERKTTSSPSPIETASPGKSGGGSGGKWILGIIGVVFVIWLINNGGQGNKKPSYNLPSSSRSQSVSYPQNSPAPTVATPHNDHPTPQQVLEVQKQLKSLDYDPGPIDGKYGRRTANAVMAFRKDMGMSQNGEIDQNLINLLKKATVSKIPKYSHPNNSYSNQKELAREIEDGKAQAKQMERQIINMDNRLKNYERRMKSYRDADMKDDYNLLVPTFNSLVKERNDIYGKYKELIGEVNAKVNRYNSTLHRQ